MSHIFAQKVIIFMFSPSKMYPSICHRKYIFSFTSASQQGKYYLRIKLCISLGLSQLLSEEVIGSGISPVSSEFMETPV